MNRLTSKTFTSALTYWTVPAGVSVVFVEGCGSGEPGKPNLAGSGVVARGGNAAALSTVPIPVIPGATYAVVCGQNGGVSSFGNQVVFAAGGENSYLQHLFIGLGTPNANDQRRQFAAPGTANTNGEGGGACLLAGGNGGALNSNGSDAPANSGSGGGSGGKSASVNTTGGNGGSGSVKVWWNE